MKKKILQQFDSLPYFTKNNLRLFQDSADFSFDKNIQNWLKSGIVKRLKSGVYVTERFILQEKDITQYQELIANTLVYPSYISTDYVLQKYNLLTEAAKTITSITTKSTRAFSNFLGTFRYYSMKEELFCGFEELEYKNMIIKQATKAKALFDYLYLSIDSFGAFSFQEIEEIRINTDEITKEDFKEFEGYVKIAKNAKMNSFYNQFKKYLCLNKN